MRDLLLNRSLATSAPGDEVRQVAKVQTLNALRTLDARHNRLVLQFLQEAGLVGTQNAAIDLRQANLSLDQLNLANLSGVDLTSADLTNANLTGADMSNATLYGAHLDKANLSQANLSNASMLETTLTSADLTGAILRNATITGANLNKAIMNSATLTSARLNGTLLAHAQLNDAYMSGADMSGVDLDGADLGGANLSETDLAAAGITQQQLDTVSSCANATLPVSGRTCHHNPKVTLQYWYTESPTEEPAILDLIRQFEQSNPEIHITPRQLPFGPAGTEFIAAAQNGDAPDVFRSAIGWVAQLASYHYLLNTDSLLSQDDRSDYLDSSLRYDYYNGHYYGVPQVTDFLALLYNRAKLKEAGIDSPPATMADFEKDAKQVVQSKAATYGFDTDGTAYDTLPFFYTFGGGMLDSHDKPIVASDGSVSGLTFLSNLKNTDKVMPPGPSTSDSKLANFRSGKTAMIFGGPYNLQSILSGPGSIFKNDQNNLGIARIPACPPETPTCQAGQVGSPLGGQSYVISANTTHPTEASTFIRFMSSKASQIEIAKANNTLPTRQSAYPELSDERLISDFHNVSSMAVALPIVPQAGHLFDSLDPRVADALDGVQSPKPALETVANVWTQLLAEPDVSCAHTATGSANC